MPSCSVYLAEEEYAMIAELRDRENLNMSQAIARLVRYGYIYKFHQKAVETPQATGEP